MFSRRFLVLVLGVFLSAADGLVAATPAAPIDRHALVTRHNPRLTTVDPWAPFSVGNGQFCFTADVTGLQTFYDHYQKNGIGLETQARWSWHSVPNPNGYQLADANKPFTAYGKTLGYPTNTSGPAGAWLRENPHAMPLPQIALDLRRDAGGSLALSEVQDVAQTLDLWSGVLTSRFTVDGERVTVITVADPERDVLAVRIDSALVARGRLGVRLTLPRGHNLRIKNNPPLDFDAGETHATRVVTRNGNQFTLEHTRDDARYLAALVATQPLAVEERTAHVYRLGQEAAAPLEFTIAFSPGAPIAARSFAQVQAAGAAHWQKFWQSGAAIDFSGSTDPRAQELERRVVLSQYLTAIQFGGDFPPSESGLTLSTWYQKHHTEMIWWHTAHFALWGRDPYLAKQLDWFVRALPVARELAKSRELKGARWAKMIGPDGRESPGGNPLIIWNQPHPIHLAELLYRNDPTPATLARYKDLVQDTAECLASMLNWDAAKQRYNLGPPMWIAQEIYDQATSMNPPYELSYWIRGLKLAQEWRERQKLPRVADWDERIAKIAKLPVKDGKYVGIETTPDTWDNKDSRHDHPSFLMALGQLPGDGVDVPTMRRTLDAVLAHWDWETKIWGWDYPMIAMTAARLGEPKKAVDVLLKSDGPNNGYTGNGHNRQRADLPIYLPGNGSLLAAVAMMAGGWDGAPTKDAPGFPKDGTWKVRSEGLKPLP